MLPKYKLLIGAIGFAA